MVFLFKALRCFVVFDLSFLCCLWYDLILLCHVDLVLVQIRPLHSSFINSSWFFHTSVFCALVFLWIRADYFIEFGFLVLLNFVIKVWMFRLCFGFPLRFLLCFIYRFDLISFVFHLILVTWFCLVLFLLISVKCCSVLHYRKAPVLLQFAVCLLD